MFGRKDSETVKLLKLAKTYPWPIKSVTISWIEAIEIDSEGKTTISYKPTVNIVYDIK